MSCTRPLDGYRASGGRVIIVERGARPPRDSTSRIPISIPCQKCVPCRMNKARQWGIRCLHEAKMWPQNSYVTLTYNNESLPPGGSVCLRDVQLFMKRLRKAREPDKIRFFLGAEYGDDNGRPHYHALLFNCGFRDRVFFGRNKRGEALYTSGELSSLWSVDGKTLGHCTIGAVTFDSAVYCAKYALKKVNGDKAYEHYQVIDEDGEVRLLVPEFAVQSRRPGIGATYFDKYGQEAVNWNSVVVNGKEVVPPRYYKERAKEGLMKGVHGVHPIQCRCKVCKDSRKNKALMVAEPEEFTPERLRVKEKLAVIAASRSERKL